jgi:hypothetical protein
MSNLMAQGHSIGQALDGLSRRAILPGPGRLNILQPNCIRDQHANVLGVRGIEPTQLPAHGSIECGPWTKRWCRWAEHVQRFAYEFLDVRLPSRRARNNDSSIQGSHTERTPRNPRGELAGGIVYVVSIAE